MRLLMLAAAGLRKHGPHAWITKGSDMERRFFSLATMNGKIYAYGGSIAGAARTHKLTEYDPVTNSWAEKTSSSGVASIAGRQRHAVAVLDNKMYVSGGNYGSTAQNSLYMYDVITDTWSVKTGTTAVQDHSLTAIDNKLFLFGGISTSSTAQAQIKSYDPTSDTWTWLTAAPVALKNHTAVAFNDKIYVYGGSLNAATTATAYFYVYDLAGDTWSALPDAPVKRKNHSAVTIGNKMYISGGVNQFGIGMNSVDVYDFVTEEWSNIPDAPAVKAYQRSAAVNGSIYLLGSDGVVGEPNALWAYAT